MGMMLKSVRTKMEKDTKLGKENKYIPYYRTGIDIFDYMNGLKRADGSLALGIPGGRAIMDIGESGSGKSTMSIQQACFIANQYENSDVIHFDFERATSPERVMQLSGWSEDKFDDKYMILTEEISTEAIYRMAKEVEKTKKELKKDIMVKMGVDKFGKDIMTYPPTIILIDSIAMMNI